jgi:two-component system, response regulator YesN
MYTMIIADDEAIARKSLELFIRKDFPEIEVVSSAGNGIEMVERIEKFKPDMAIVDINMPGIDGISAIGLLKDKGIKTHFVINTAYSDFEYVKNALKMKVDGYLLKPGIHEESVSTIRQICENIRKEKDENRKNLQMHSFFRTISPILENEILLSVCSGVPAEKEFLSYCEVNEIRFQGGSIITLMNSGETKANKREIRNIISGALRNICDHMLLVLENTVTLFLLLPGNVGIAESNAWFCDVTELLTESLLKGIGIRYKVGRGNFYESFAKMPDSYRQSLDAFKHNGTNAATVPEPPERENHGNGNDYVEYAVRYIDAHFREDLSLDLVAAKIGISSFYLSRLMKQIQNVAFVEYLTEVRMRQARELALHTELPIAEIAVKCGYSNVTYFYKVFKKTTGKTIGAFRKNSRKDS